MDQYTERASALIQAERNRQVDVLGYTPDHDREQIPALWDALEVFRTGNTWKWPQHWRSGPSFGGAVHNTVRWGAMALAIAETGDSTQIGAEKQYKAAVEFLAATLREADEVQ